MFLRMWPALASWGAGLIHLAVAAAAPPAALAVLALIGAAELAWGVATLRAERPVAPGVTLASAIAVLAACIAFALGGVMGWLPFASASVFVVFIAGAAAVALRQAARGTPAAEAATPARDAARRPGQTIAGLAVGATLVAGLTTPALAATEAGEHAVPHGEMPGHSGH